MRRVVLAAPLVVGLGLGLGPGCAPAIGDSCSTALDCSVNGDRTCDLARPNGACTVFGCESLNCPDEAVCVRWRPEPARLSFTACMRRCDQDSDCRIDEGYECMAAEEVTANDEEGGEPIAEVVDVERDDSGFFCVARVPEPEPQPDD